MAADFFDDWNCNSSAGYLKYSKFLLLCSDVLSSKVNYLALKE